MPYASLESVRVCGRIVFQPPAATLVGSRMVGLVSQEPRERAGPWVLGPLSHMRAMRSRFCLGRVLAPALGAASKSEPWSAGSFPRGGPPGVRVCAAGAPRVGRGCSSPPLLSSLGSESSKCLPAPNKGEIGSPPPPHAHLRLRGAVSLLKWVFCAQILGLQAFHATFFTSPVDFGQMSSPQSRLLLEEEVVCAWAGLGSHPLSLQ